MSAVDHVSDSRPSAYEENGVAVYRASAVGGCIKALTAARLGYTPIAPNEKSERVMNEGNIHEPHILSSLEREHGWVIGRRQDELELPVGTGIIIRCHPDGVITTSERADHLGRVVEAKAMGKDVFAKWLKHGWESNRRYAYQMSIEMHCLNMPGVFAVKNRDNGEIHTTFVDQAPFSLAEVKARVAKVEAAAREAVLPQCDPQSWLCDFFYLHDQPVEGGGEGGGGGDEVVENDEAVDALAALLFKARLEKKQAEAMEKEARERLMLNLGEREKVATNFWKVAVSTSKRASLDMEQLKKDVDVAAYQKVSEVVQVRVTPQGGGVDEIPG